MTEVSSLEHDIATLLDDLSEVQHDLLNVLGRRRDAMAKQDLAAMQELDADESVLLQRLQDCRRRRGEILESAQKEGQAAGSLEDLAKKLPSENRGEIGRQVKEASLRMRLLQNGSLVNWVGAQLHLLHVAHILEIFATGGRGKPTYGKGSSAHARGSLMDRSA